MEQIVDDPEYEAFTFGPRAGGIPANLYYAVVACLMCLMSGLGATMKPVDILNVTRRPKGIYVGLLSQFGYMPLIAFISCYLSGWSNGDTTQKVWAITLVLQGCTPGGSSSNLYTYFSKGDLPLSVCMTISSTLCAFVMLPSLLLFYTFLLDGEGTSTMDIKQVFANLMAVVVPVGFGMLVRT
tara:strand:- start:112 stop:660 length:549 start_codon:yes stop_codon:yes gene_type:complete